MVPRFFQGLVADSRKTDERQNRIASPIGMLDKVLTWIALVCGVVTLTAAALLSVRNVALPESGTNVTGRSRPETEPDRR